MSTGRDNVTFRSDDENRNSESQQLDQIADDLARTPIDADGFMTPESSLSDDINKPEDMNAEVSSSQRANDLNTSSSLTESSTLSGQISENVAFEPSQDTENSDNDDKRHQGLTKQQIELKRQIVLVQSDQSLSSSEKASKIQALMMSQYKKKKLHASISAPAGTPMSMDSVSPFPNDSQGAGEPVEDQLAVPSLITGGKELIGESASKPCFQCPDILGCQHYQRGVKLQAACCGKWVSCRLCHDEDNDHKMDRKATKAVLCMHCTTIQEPSNSCKSCKNIFAKYYCEKCKLWEDDPEKPIYHCDKCGLCRIGKGLGIDYFHCDTCDACLAISLKDNHRCIERNLDSDCPICGEYMFTSTETVMFMPCAHGIHWRCYQEHIQNSYQCPICWKSLANMDNYFGQIDKMLEEHQMPAEYEDYYSYILCNDCEKKSRTKYHFLYHKCQECGSYNTKLVKTVQERSLNAASSGTEESNDDTPGSRSLQTPDLTDNFTVRPRSGTNRNDNSS